MKTKSVTEQLRENLYIYQSDQVSTSTAAEHHVQVQRGSKRLERVAVMRGAHSLAMRASDYHMPDPHTGTNWKLVNLSVHRTFMF